MRCLMTLCMLLVCTSPVMAQGDLGRAEALGASSALVSSALRRASLHEQDARDAVSRQAAIEAQLGLQLYQLGEDWRAVSAMQRYQLLARSQRSAFVGNLIIGQIYDRNARASLAELSFEQAAAAAPDLESRVWSVLLEAQQGCIRQDTWRACALRLDDIATRTQGRLSPRLAETLWMQHAVAATMLQSTWPELPEQVKLSARFEQNVASLHMHAARFDALPLRKPWLAGTLSAVVPGAGQVYNRKWGDALIAFGLNALFASATYYSFAELDSVPLGVGSALLFSGFYVGNVINARQDVSRYNALIYQGYYESIKVRHWPVVTFEVNEDEVLFDSQIAP